MSIQGERILALQRLHILQVDRGNRVAEDSVISVGISAISLFNCCD